MNKQEIFDKVVNHARTQNQKAIEGGQCKYRTSNGLKCFIGALIPDDKYDPYLEGHISSEVLKAIGIDYTIDNRIFLCELLIIHDQKIPDSWELEFQSFAKKHNLDYNLI